jgi:cob(I)alamin adenosyltransferase
MSKSTIATKTGDQGMTRLIYGQKVPKSHARVEAVGRFDEFNAALGLAKATARGEGRAELADELEAIQRDLVPLMGELSADDADQERYLSGTFGHLTLESLARLDAGVARLENGEPPLCFDGWATPGKTTLGATLDLARVAARRAERHLAAMRESGSVVRGLALQYVNRVSDLLWLLARQAEQ